MTGIGKFLEFVALLGPALGALGMTIMLGVIGYRGRKKRRK